MDCKKSYGLMMKYMDGTLGEKDSALLREHTASCEACNADFGVYRHMTEELDKGGLTPAPEGFTISVMKSVALLPGPVKVNANSLSKLLRIAAGVLSLLFGIGFLLAMHREAVVDYLSALPVFGRVIEISAPLTESLSTQLNTAADAIYGAFQASFDFLAEYRYVFLGAALAIIGLTLLIARNFSRGEKSVKSKIK